MPDLLLERRFQIANENAARIRSLCEAGVRQRHPDYSDDDVRIAIMRLMIGEACFRRCFPEHLEIRP